MTVHAPAPKQDAQDRIVHMLGLDPMETLEKLRVAQTETAKLKRKEADVLAILSSHEARFAYPSHFEHERKHMLASIAEDRRQQLLDAGVKVVESYLDSFSHAHPKYRRFLKGAGQERLEMETHRAELAKVRAEIETAKATETYYERLARLNESLVYFAGREAGLS